MSPTSNSPSLFSLALFLVFGACPILAEKPHIINFRSPNLYPEGITWDPSDQHFLVGSLHHRSILAVSDAGIVETFIADHALPVNASILGLAVDSTHRRLLAVVHAAEPLPQFDALAAYDLRTRRRLFLAHLPPSDPAHRPVANDVAVDFLGNAYVTNSEGNFIWKVDVEGEPSIFSRSTVFSAYPVERDAPYSACGLNGIAYISKGYLLVVQSNTGKMFKVSEDGTARMVPLTEDLPLADGIAVRGDGVVVVVSPHTAWFLKSDDSWGQGVVYDKTALDVPRFPTSVAMRGRERAYVLYGHVEEGIMGNSEREWFGIEEMGSEKESGEEHVWAFLMLGLAFAYFLFWRFQMGRLANNMNKKTD
ncbi:uncharacterized protein LOC131144126 [Malania oleifera]|uniref:uncharacterized protein LOC131144126 n=1 Tax=Malania oleifera TaxID=397392 RepID=UPI0025ADF807|nr:uncharacterized protein LOC131144126 [Malania oleifera]